MKLANTLTYKVVVYCHKSLSPWDQPWSFGFLRYLYGESLASIEGKDSVALVVLHPNSLFCLSWSSQKKSLQESWVCQTSNVCNLVTLAHLLSYHPSRSRRERSCHRVSSLTPKMTSNPKHFNELTHAQTKCPYTTLPWCAFSYRNVKGGFSRYPMDSCAYVSL